MVTARDFTSSAESCIDPVSRSAGSSSMLIRRLASPGVSASRAPGPTSLCPCGATLMLSTLGHHPHLGFGVLQAATVSSASRWRDGRKPCGRNRIMTTRITPKIRKLYWAGLGSDGATSPMRWPMYGSSVLST